MSALSLGSLFSGIGGLELGLERAGMHVRWQVESDAFCRRVLAKHWPRVPKHNDVRGVGGHNLEAVDVICGGFPCQDISSANTSGRRAGLEGKQSGLWGEFRRIAGELRPRWLVIENSPRWRAWVPSVRLELWGLGYSSLPLLLRAADVGAHHERPRAFVVAHAHRDSQPLRALNAEMACLPALPSTSGHWRDTPPGVFRMADGLPHRMDRLRAVGNAVVPDVAHVIGRLIAAQAGGTT